jgi:hypothetical protein
VLVLDMRRPRPIPARVEALLARFAKHPALAWAEEQYRRERPPSAAVAA